MTSPNEIAKVWFLPWNRKHELAKLLELSSAAAPFHEGDFCAVKMHFGERGNDGYIRPEYLAPFLQMISACKGRAFLTDTCTIYAGPRKDALGHLEVAAEHGFTQESVGVPVIIADGLHGTDDEQVEVAGTHFRSVKIARAIAHADSMLVLSHFKGHLMGGFGGAIKNLGMGCGSRRGKFEMHSGATPQVDAALCKRCGACVTACDHRAISLTKVSAQISIDRCVGCGECVLVCPYGAMGLAWNQGPKQVQERYAEYALGAVKGKRAFYVNFLNHITPNCDCLSEGEDSLVADIGILASSDPVAIDQACYDLVLKAGGDVFAQTHPGVDGTVQLAHAENIGLGSRTYDLIEV